ncbi:MAG: GDSL-type esterase/lipase family protein [Bacteroides sp.]
MKQVLCFGDSNTWGLIPATTERYDWDTRWTGITGNKLIQDGYRVIEEGLCGRTTVFDDPLRIGRRGTEILPVLLETHKPVDIIVLMLGTNDCKSFYGASANIIGLGIKKLLEQIRDTVPYAKILLISPIHLGDDIWDGYDPEFNEDSVKVSKDLGKVYEQIAKEENINYLAASDYAKPSKEDREHMDKDGHKALAEAVINELEKIIAE